MCTIAWERGVASLTAAVGETLALSGIIRSVTVRIGTRVTRAGFGGMHTTAERRARWGDDAIPTGFIRLRAGCEDTDDLLADCTQALEKLA